METQLMTSVMCPLSVGGWALNRKDLKLLQTIGKGEFGGEETFPSFHFKHEKPLHGRLRLLWILYEHFTVPFVPARCDGGRLQRDQGGGQVYQKWRHSAGVHRWGLGHDVSIPVNIYMPLRLHVKCKLLYRMEFDYYLLHLCFVKATEAQQPGAVVRSNCGGAGQPLHRHRIHG